jgi:hypothetical protein
VEIVYGMLLVNVILGGACGVVALRDWLYERNERRQIEEELAMIETERRARR